MSNRTRILDNIPAIPSRDMILVRLGYRRDTTNFGPEQEAFLQEGIGKALSLCHPKGVYGRLPIVEKGENHVVIEENIRLESGSLARLLASSSEVLLMAATVGGEVTAEAFRQVEAGDAALGVILDAAASQTADAAVAWVMEFAGKLVRREGRQLTKHRYSPGFGDLALSCQEPLFGLLGLDRLGLRLTEKYMLVPEKSVIAIAGIEAYR